ncbi:MAG: hypothetical protein ACRC6V_07940 [Bacteroidales bacterium]
MIALFIFAYCCYQLAAASPKKGWVKFLHFVWVAVVSYAVFTVAYLTFTEVTATAGNFLVELVASAALYYCSYKLYQKVLG